jgi:hypothetical protein
MLSAARRRPNRSVSVSGSEASRSAKQGKRSLIGFSAVTPSSLPRRCARERAAQPVRIGRHQDEVHMVRHQAPGPHRDADVAAMFGEQVAVERIVTVAEERLRAAVAALGDMVRMTGDDDTCEASYAA